MPDVLITLNDRTVVRVAIASPETTIGRDETCDVTVDNPGISRVHAKIIANHGGYVIRDLGSENGVIINGQRVTESDLQFESSVGLGKFRLQLVDSTPESRPAGSSSPSGAAPRNIVKTVTIDDEAARRIQARLAEGPPSSKAPPIRRNVESSSEYTWLWWAGAAFVVAFGVVVAMRMFSE